MATAAQAAANAVNAQASTGPRTDEGKAVSSKNSVTLGLFSGDFVRVGEESIYATLAIALSRDLAPVGTLEDILANEILRATWRLRRCGEVESNLVIRLSDDENYTLDPMESGNAAIEKIQNSVDRARSQAHRLLHRATAELRKLQTERQYRAETAKPETAAASFGLANRPCVAKAVRTPIASTKQPVAQRTQFPLPPEPASTLPCSVGAPDFRNILDFIAMPTGN